jgi:hypothetical protein
MQRLIFLFRESKIGRYGDIIVTADMTSQAWDVKNVCVAITDESSASPLKLSLLSK